MAYFLAPALGRLRFEINALWPHRDKTSDGWIGDTSHAARPSDHNPAPPDGIVRAIDIDEDLVVGLADAGEAMPLVNQIISDVRTRYVIYEGRIWTRDTGQWRGYSGANAHRHHIHVSVRSVSGLDRDARPWNISRSTSAGSGGGGFVSIPNVPGAPAPVAPTPKDWFDMATEADLRKVVTEVFADRHLPLAKQAEADTYLREIPNRTANAILDKGLGQGVGTVRRALEDSRVISRRAELQVIALGAAVGAMAKDRGIDAATVTKAVQDAVDDALSDIKITLTTGE